MSQSVNSGGAGRGENRARAAGELVLGSELLPGPVPLPDFVSLLAGRSRRRRRGLFLGTFGSVAALAFGAILMLRERAPVWYVVDGTVAIADGVIDASGLPSTSGRMASVRFSEGTEVGLAPGARLRVVDRTAHGAVLALDRGRARFAVTHRPGARWSVATGPFTVDVVGTRFSLDWSPRDERLVVELTSGSVQIRGASVGGPVAMHAGERLIATAADRSVTLSPLVEGHGETPLTGQEPGLEPGQEAGQDTGLEPGLEPGPEALAEPPADLRPARGGIAAVSRPVPTRSIRRATRRALLALANPARPQPAMRASSPPPSRSTPSSSVLPSRPSSPSSSSSSSSSYLPDPPSPSAPRPEPQAPRFAPQVMVSPGLGAGGGACAREGSQYRFERNESGISLPDFYTLAFSAPRTDHSRSWCGQGSLRVDATFNDAGRRNFFGRFAKETGQVVLKLHRTTDFTGKTVTVHFFVDGPADARFTAELVVVNRGRWVSGPPSGHLTPGRWWTISHRFEAENESGVPGSSNPGPYPEGGTSPVSETDRLGLAIHSTGGRRVWTGAVYVDDVGWK